MRYESFSIYGFKIEYPVDWTVELNPKSSRTRGDVVFHSPTKDKFFVSWYSLELVRKKYASLTKHANEIIKKIKKTSGVKSVEVIRQKEVEINKHRTIFMHLRVTSSSTFFRKREIFQENRALHMYCEQTARYFVLYESTRPNERWTEQEDIFNHMQKSFKCHSE
jgi:copper chaperone CopZ